MRGMVRRALPWLVYLILGLILFLPKDVLDQSENIVLASGWFGTGAEPVAVAAAGPPA